MSRSRLHLTLDLGISVLTNALGLRLLQRSMNRLKTFGKERRASCVDSPFDLYLFRAGLYS